MAKLTGAVVKLKSGDPVKADCHGNNAAITCPVCLENPVLITTGPIGPRGNHHKNPVICSCGASIWMDPPADALKDPIKLITIDKK